MSGIRKTDQNPKKQEILLFNPEAYAGLTPVVALDCEFVGVGLDGKDNALARASIVNLNGHTLLDMYVRPKERVIDFRTEFSGIRPRDIKKAEAVSFEEAHKAVSDIVANRILVGHSIKNDLKTLFLSHPRKKICDTSQVKQFKALVNGGTPSLKLLAEKLLNKLIQRGEHDSVEDARSAMAIYRTNKHLWSNNRHTKINSSMPKAGEASSAMPPKQSESRRDRFIRRRIEMRRKQTAARLAKK